MRISDWSSDVCSSDLIGHGFFPGRRFLELGQLGIYCVTEIFGVLAKGESAPTTGRGAIDDRVGKVCGRFDLFAFSGQLTDGQAGGRIRAGASVRYRLNCIRTILYGSHAIGV